MFRDWFQKPKHRNIAPRFLVYAGGDGDSTPAFDWYVDSVRGNDAYSGQSAGMPLATIAGLMSKTILANQRIGLARGSHWREELDLTVTPVSVGSYGSGALPILDGSDILGGGVWAKTGGLTNVYETALSLPGNVQNWLNAWENGVYLINVASQAACDATAGTYYATAMIGAVTLYIHPYGDTNPISDGKVYEATVRSTGLHSLLGVTVDSILTQKSLQNNGSIIIGRLSTVTNCTCQYGSEHVIELGEGTLVDNCTFQENYNPPGVHALMAFIDSHPNGAGVPVTVRNCLFTRAVYDDDAGGILIYPTATYFGVVTVENCTFVNLGRAFQGGSFSVCNFINNIAIESGGAGLIAAYSFAGIYNIVNVSMASSVNKAMLLVVSASGAGSTVNISRTNLSKTVVVNTVESGVVEVKASTVTVTITNMDIEASGLTTSNGVVFANASLTDVSITVNGSRIAVTGATGQNYRLLTAPTYVGDNNTFYRNHGQPLYRLGATTYASLVLWQAAVTPQDAASTVQA